MTIEWNAIRKINGSQATGFEELCAQLANAESPTSSNFIRKGPPDAGVECYTILNDGGEWGWQSKFFDSLKDSQFSQLDNSVLTALKKHPRLIRLYICIPLDRPDGRVDRQRRSDGQISRDKSALDRWNEHVLKWESWALERSMNVEFVYWGSHELLYRLTRPEHVGRVRFFFNASLFDRTWFTDRLDEAIRSAGPRYSPEIHVDLPIAADFEAFGRTERFFDQIKAHARGIRKELQSFDYSESQAPVFEEKFTSSLVVQVKEILIELGAIKPEPIGDLPFQRIADLITSVEEAVEAKTRWLFDQEKEYKTISRESASESKLGSYKTNPFSDRRYTLTSLSFELRQTLEALSSANDYAGGALLLLKGKAGTGKTHLLCDVARHRIAENRPTVLLMGQRFVSTDEPWTQVLQQLDLPNLTAEEFTKTLEAAAQTAGCRAVVMIDAINEGTGRQIWPMHLPAFLASLERSPWIGVVLSVRSSYEELIVPEEVRIRAVSITHEGFEDHEYDAARIFFSEYNLEFPSTPLLAPEFSNPLFLKTLCKGLQARREQRLPRGSYGITAIFDLYLDAINKRLAKELDYDPEDTLVKKALEAFAKELVSAGKLWLPRERTKGVVDALLPGREFERSLYRRLITEGLLINEIIRGSNTELEEVVAFAYERFGDHLVAKVLLDTHFDLTNLGSCFVGGAPLSFLCNEREYVSPGLLEAICIQVPERIGNEFVLLAPEIEKRWGIGDAFRQSLIWRDIAAYSEDTKVVINKLIRSPHDGDDTLEMLLTVATLPDHPYNAIFLDQYLRRDPMASRDAWWSIYLHRTWNTHGAVNRLVDWASSIRPDTNIDEKTIELCAITLSWMLSTSNRFLRDRATKSLVNLLTGRLYAVTQIIKRFADVDDPYVVERIYAVAYGTAMRSHDPVELAPLAQSVYDARGVVERAVYLRANINIVLEKIRPPYGSQWPVIPTEEDIQPLLPDWSRGSYDSGSLEWAHNKIGFSVMDGDFASYVIGTNHSHHSHQWLSLKFDEPAWQSLDTRLKVLLEDFSESEMNAWIAFKESEDRVRQYIRPQFLEDFELEKIQEEDSLNSECRELELDIRNAEQERDALFTSLESVLTEQHSHSLKEILAEKEDADKRDPPGFDLHQVQRYILWRVFEMGWTPERFAEFDRFGATSHGRKASKAERIGKKYQWIAYHEIMALIADHFQYLEDYHADTGYHGYDGPWQCHLRDIDPSSTVLISQGGTSLGGHSPAWWGSARYDDWGDHLTSEEWVTQCDDLPKIENLLVTVNPEDNSRWLNVQGYLNWVKQPPADQESTAVEHRDVWYIFFAYLIRKEDIDAFTDWAKRVDFMGRWMPERPSILEIFLGEHGWSPAFQHFQKQYYHDVGTDGWTQPDNGCPVKVRVVGVDYRSKMDDFDCSADENFTLRLPASELVTGLGLQWSGSAADYLDPNGRLAVFDPTIHAEGPNALLFREDLMRAYLEQEDLVICWIILGEKQILGGFDLRNPMRLEITGAYFLSEDELKGFVQSKVKGESGVIKSVT